MAKIALIFFFAFCAFQLSTAARIPRDVKADDNALDNALQQITQFWEKTLSKENLEKVGTTLKEFGDQVSERGKNLLQQADAEFKKLQAKE